MKIVNIFQSVFNAAGTILDPKTQTTLDNFHNFVAPTCALYCSIRAYRLLIPDIYVHVVHSNLFTGKEEEENRKKEKKWNAFIDSNDYFHFCRVFVFSLFSAFPSIRTHMRHSSRIYFRFKEGKKTDTKINI